MAEMQRRDMEYGNFLLIGANALPECMQVEFIEYLNWLRNDNFKALENELKDRLEIKAFPKRSNEDILEGIIISTDKEFERKTKDKNYYICQALCILDVVRYIFDDKLVNNLEELSKDSKMAFFVENYADILRKIQLDMEDLCSMYSQKIKHEGKYQSNIRNRYVHSLALHQVLRQGLYGNFSYHSFSDREVSPTIGTIREIIELRIRRSFGAIAFMDEDSVIHPLDLSVLIGVIKKYKEKISFPIKLENIDRLYRWANAFVHSGRADYNWVPFFLERMLREFSLGKERTRANGGFCWNVNNGISTTQDVIDAIRADLIAWKNEKKADGDKEYRLIQPKPECEIVTAGTEIRKEGF